MQPGIPSALRAIRKQRGLTQRDVAKRLGLTHSAASRYERTDANPTRRTIETYLEACGADLQDLARALLSQAADNAEGTAEEVVADSLLSEEAANLERHAAEVESRRLEEFEERLRRLEEWRQSQNSAAS